MLRIDALPNLKLSHSLDNMTVITIKETSFITNYCAST